MGGSCARRSRDLARRGRASGRAGRSRHCDREMQPRVLVSAKSGLDCELPSPYFLVSVDSKEFKVALLTFSTGGARPQAIEVVGESEEEGLSDLQDQATARSLFLQLAFHHREDGFHLRPLSVLFLRKIAIHLPAQRSLRNTPTWLCRNNTLRPPAVPNRQGIGFGIELGLGQHQAQWCESCRRIP